MINTYRALWRRHCTQVLELEFEEHADSSAKGSKSKFCTDIVCCPSNVKFLYAKSR